MDNIKTIPVVGQLINIFDSYPRLSAWVVLSVGIVGLLIYEARDVGLTIGNWVALIVASVLVAGLCIWIVSWEDEEEAENGAILIKSTAETEKTQESNDTSTEDASSEAESTSAADSGSDDASGSEADD